jgi:formylglycine-generating enzyme required for sulfatase activity
MPIEEQELITSIKGLTRRVNIKKEHLENINTALSSNNLSPEQWENLLNKNNINLALNNKIYTQEMTRLLTLRAIVIPNTLIEYLTWLDEGNKQKTRVLDYSLDFQAQIQTLLGENENILPNIQLQIFKGKDLIVEQLYKKNLELKIFKIFILNKHNLWQSQSVLLLAQNQTKSKYHKSLEQTTKKPEIKQKVPETTNLPPNVSRASFLKYLGWGGATFISIIMVGSFLRNNDKRETEPTPSSDTSPTTEPTPNQQSFTFEMVQVDSYGQIIKRETKSANYITLDLGNGVTMELVEIPGGTFMMGASVNEKDSDDSERPEHKVTIQPFYIGKYQVNQAQWQAIMSNNPSYFKDPPGTPLTKGRGNHPVERVSWEDCQEFCKKLSAKINQEVCLPSEAQWEYACRAGTTTPFYFGETITTDLANYNGNYTYANESKGIYRGETTPVGSFPPNAFGLYDMHGNVWEWCQDNWYGSYNSAPNDGSARVSENSKYYVVRGGSWNYNPKNCRSASRYHFDFARDYDLEIGFRVMLCVRRTT